VDSNDSLRDVASVDISSTAMRVKRASSPVCGGAGDASPGVSPGIRAAMGGTVLPLRRLFITVSAHGALWLWHTDCYYRARIPGLDERPTYTATDTATDATTATAT
jgi:hypothetical protein